VIRCRGPRSRARFLAARRWRRTIRVSWRRAHGRPGDRRLWLRRVPLPCVGPL